MRTYIDIATCHKMLCNKFLRQTGAYNNSFYMSKNKVFLEGWLFPANLSF